MLRFHASDFKNWNKLNEENPRWIGIELILKFHESQIPELKEKIRQAHIPLKLSVYWNQKRPKKNFKMNVVK